MPISTHIDRSGRDRCPSWLDPGRPPGMAACRAEPGFGGDLSQAAIAWAEGETLITAPVVIST